MRRYRTLWWTPIIERMRSEIVGEVEGHAMLRWCENIQLSKSGYGLLFVA